MLNYQNRIVYRQQDGKWANKLTGASRPSSLHASQKEAIAMAKQMLIDSGGGELKLDMHTPDVDDALMPSAPVRSQATNEGDHAS